MTAAQAGPPINCIAECVTTRFNIEHLAIRLANPIQTFGVYRRHCSPLGVCAQEVIGFMYGDVWENYALSCAAGNASL